MTSPAALADRFDALARFVRLVRPHLDGGEGVGSLERAAALSERAAGRLRIVGEHTVVALAGATGSGKSSLFNALARMDLSPTGHLRPTTGEAHACVWGDEDATALLDWLGVGHRFRRESMLDAQDEASLHGLVLLDLPDMDSIATTHRIETDRLVGIVDLVVWVLDPQKYADQTVHDDYLSRLGALRDVTVVVFNQTDRLTPADVARCRADLVRLIEADGLAGVAVIATSARTGDGVGELRTLLEKVISGRHAAVDRFEGELAAALTEVTPLVRTSADQPEEQLSRGAIQHFADDLAGAAGAEGAEGAAGEVGAAGTAGTAGTAGQVGAAAPGAAEPAAVRAALRHLAALASVGLAPAWSDRVQAVAAAQQDGVVAALDRATAAVRPRPRRAVGRALVRLLWWLGVAAALIGLGWIVWAAFAGAAVPRIEGLRVSALLAVGGAIVAVLALIARPLLNAGERRAGLRAERRRREACLGVAREAVGPIRAVLRDHADARVALAAAGERTGPGEPTGPRGSTGPGERAGLG